MFRKLLMAVALLFPAAAQAQWKEASSTNFVVYSEGSEAELRAFTAKLEKFDYVLRTYHGVKEPPSPYKLRVFLMPNIQAVGNVAGREGTAGYYVTRARGLMLVGTRDRTSRSRIDSESILLHEYTHHFMYQYFPATYPTWYSEGFAEFWGATRFLPGNVVEVGAPVEYRFGSLVQNRWLPIERLLTAQNYADVATHGVDLLYAQGWLLKRYTFENPERRQQLEQYLNLINAGSSYEEAMNKAFGDPRRLNNELFNYAGRTGFNVVRLPFRALEVGDISVRTPGPAEQALMTHEIRISQGMLASDAAAFAREVRQIAGRFPDDPFALALLAEAERLAGQNEAALAAVDRLLQVQPDHARGLVTKAMLQVDSLRAAESTDQGAWDAARALIVRANRIKPDDPVILAAYHDTFTAQGVLPPEGAQNALYAAMELAPSDGEIRFKLARDFEHRGMLREAMAIIRSEAYRQPHRGEESDRERQRREELAEKFRRAGSVRPTESAREMYERLKIDLEAQERQSAAR